MRLTKLILDKGPIVCFVLVLTFVSFGNKASAALYLFNGTATTTVATTSPYSSNISLTANSIFSQDATDTTPYTLSGIISGVGFGINIQNGATTTFSGTNTYSGTTTVGNGILVFSNAVPASNNWVINYNPDVTSKITLPASPDINNKVVNVVTTSTNISTSTALVSWTGTATGTPTLKWNGVTVNSGAQINGTQISIVSSSTSGIFLQPMSPVAPGSVTNLNAVSPESGQVTLSWTAPISMGSAPISDYQIEYFELKNLMPMGDSITSGYQAWRYQFATNVNNDNKNIGLIGRSTDSSLPTYPVNQQGFTARSSYSTIDALNNIDGLNSDLFNYYGGSDRNPLGGYWISGGSSFFPMYPDIMTVQFGSNDCDRETAHPEVKPVIGINTFTRNLSLLIDKIFSLRPQTNMYVAKVTPSTVYPDCLSQIWPMVDTVVNNFKNQGYNISTVDLSDMPTEYLAGDGVHSTQTGYNWIANKWYNGGISSSTPWTTYTHELLNDTRINISGLDSGVTYFFRVTAKNSDGLSGTPVYVKNVIAKGPVAPSILLPTSQSTSTLSFSWSGVIGASSYTYSLSTVGTNSPSVVSTGTTRLTHVTLSDLNPGTRYAFTLRSTDGTAYSKALTVGATTLVYKPINFIANTSTSTASLSWSPAFDMDSFNTDSVYSIYQNGTLIATTSSSTLSYTVSSLSPGSKYNFDLYSTKTSYAYSEPDMIGKTIESYSTSSPASISATTLSIVSQVSTPASSSSGSIHRSEFTDLASHFSPTSVPSLLAKSTALFTADLSKGVVNIDVKLLQQYLNAHGYLVSNSGAGSLGKETNVFGPATKAALIKFQKAVGIKPAVGYFGPVTRGYINNH